MGSVVFDPVAFKLRYPEFAAIPDGRLYLFFDEATLYLSNANCSPIQNLARRATFFNMLTAHIAWLSGALNGGTSPLPVGRTSSASEGSVSVGLEYLTPGTHEWFTQSQYGAAFWQATLSLRSFRYYPQPTRF